MLPQLDLGYCGTGKVSLHRTHLLPRSTHRPLRLRYHFKALIRSDEEMGVGTAGQRPQGHRLGSSWQ